MSAPTPSIDVAKMAQMAGHQETNGAVYKITVCRDDPASGRRSMSSAKGRRQ
jgi:hypothetical protein